MSSFDERLRKYAEKKIEGRKGFTLKRDFVTGNPMLQEYGLNYCDIISVHHGQNFYIFCHQLLRECLTALVLIFMMLRNWLKLKMHEFKTGKSVFLAFDKKFMPVKLNAASVIYCLSFCASWSIIKNLYI